MGAAAKNHLNQADESVVEIVKGPSGKDLLIASRDGTDVQFRAVLWSTDESGDYTKGAEFRVGAQMVEAHPEKGCDGLVVKAYLIFDEEMDSLPTTFCYNPEKQSAYI